MGGGWFLKEQRVSVEWKMEAWREGEAEKKGNRLGRDGERRREGTESSLSTATRL